MSKVCPTCGSPADVHETEVTSNSHHVQHVDGGTDEFMESWQRYYCENCGETFAVQIEEVHLRHHD